MASRSSAAVIRQSNRIRRSISEWRQSWRRPYPPIATSATGAVEAPVRALAATRIPASMRSTAVEYSREACRPPRAWRISASKRSRAARRASAGDCPSAGALSREVLVIGSGPRRSSGRRRPMLRPFTPEAARPAAPGTGTRARGCAAGAFSAPGCRSRAGPGRYGPGGAGQLATVRKRYILPEERRSFRAGVISDAGKPGVGYCRVDS